MEDAKMNVLIADLDVICNEELELLQSGAERVHALYSDVKRQLPLSAVRIIAQWAAKGILYLDSSVIRSIRIVKG